MASRSDIEAGKAHVLVYVKNQVAAGLKAIGTSLQTTGRQAIAVGSSVAAAGAAIVGPLAAAVQHFVAVGGAIDDMSARTGIGVASLSRLGYAAEQSGIEIGDVEKSVMKMQRTIAEAAAGNAAAAESLAALGLSAQELAGLLPEEQLALIGKGLTAIPDPAQKTAAAMEILGKSGTKLIPMLRDLEHWSAEADRLGIVVDPQSVALAAELGDMLNDLTAIGKAAVLALGAALAPALIPAAAAARNIAAEFGKWLKENAQIVRTVGLIGAGLVAAGAIVTGIGLAIFTIGTAFTAMAGAITTVGAILGTSLAVLLSPVGILVGVLGGLAFLWFRFSDAGKSALGQVLAALRPFIDTFQTTFQGIFDALAGGDLALAGQIAITGLQLVLAQGLAAIVSLFEGTFADLLGTIGTQLIEGDFVGAWETAALAITSIWDSLVAGVLETMQAMVDKIRQLWNVAIIGIRGSIGGLHALSNRYLGGTSVGSALSSFFSAADSAAAVGGAVGDVGLSVASAGTGILSAAANARERETADALNTKIAGGADRAGKAADDLAARLAELSGRAAEARARVGASFAAESPAAGIADQAKQTSVAGGFAGAALLALGQGGKTGIERIADEQLKEQKKLNSKIDEQIDINRRLERALTVA